MILIDTCILSSLAKIDRLSSLNIFFQKSFLLYYSCPIKGIKHEPILQVDETSIKVQGKKYWFHHTARDFYCDSEEPGTKVLMEVLTRRFKGIIVCDGWKPYAKFTNRIRAYVRAHLLGDRWISPRRLRRRFLYERALTRLYGKLTDALESDPPPEIREKLLHNARSNAQTMAQ